MSGGVASPAEVGNDNDLAGCPLRIDTGNHVGKNDARFTACRSEIDLLPPYQSRKVVSDTFKIFIVSQMSINGSRAGGPNKDIPGGTAILKPMKHVVLVAPAGARNNRELGQRKWL